MSGAWLWPAFLFLTVVDGVLITLLPPYSGTPPGLVGGLLLAGFANLLLTAVVAPFAGRALRRRRPDLPRPVALDYAGTALLCALTVVLVLAGLAHRPAVGRAGAATRPRWSRPCARTSRRTRPSGRPGSASSTRAPTRPTSTAPACRGATRAGRCA